MTQLFAKDGTCIPVTVIQVGPCPVVQIKSKDGKDGYDAVQIALEPKPARNDGQGTPRANKPTVGHYKRAGLEPHRHLREVRVALGKNETLPELGTVLTAESVFTGITKVGINREAEGRPAGIGRADGCRSVDPADTLTRGLGRNESL